MNRFRNLLEQWGWLDLVIGGIIWAGFHIWLILYSNINNSIEVVPVLWIPGIGTIFLLLGTISIFLLATNIGVMGGLGVLIIGLVLFSSGTVLTSFWTNSAFLLVIFGEMIITIGLLIFAIANLFVRMLGFLFWLPLFMVPIYFISWSVDPGATSFLLENWTEWLAVLYGLGWVAAGIGFKRQVQKENPG